MALRMTSDVIPSKKEDVLSLANIDSEYQEILNTRGRMPPFADQPLSALRDGLANMLAQSAQPTPPHLIESTTRIPNRSDTHQITFKSYAAKATTSTHLPIFLLLHGGGLVFGAPAMEEPTARMIAEKHEVVVITADYRFAPENPYPAAFDDVWDAAVYLSDPINCVKLNDRADPSVGFIVGGTSAGAGLGLSITYRSRNIGLVEGDEAALKTPVTGVYAAIPGVMHPKRVPEEYQDVYLSMEQNKGAELWSRDDWERCKEMVGTPEDSKLAYPLSNLPVEARGNLPKTVVQICGRDPSRDDGLCLARAIQNYDPDNLKLKIYKGLPHGFHVYAPQISAAQKWREDQLAGVGWLLGASETT